MALRAADPSLWYCMPGVIVAYQAIGAPDALSGRRNMAHGGDARYWATPGTAPTWHPRIGWTCDGSAQYLDTGLVPSVGSTWSMLVLYSGATTLGVVAGLMDDTCSPVARFATGPYWYGNDYWSNGQNQANDSVQTTDGVLGFAGGGGYRNGLYVMDIYAAAGGSSALTVWVGCRNYNGAYNAGFGGNIQALLICDRTLSAAENWMAAQQMKYCHVNTAWNVWAPQRRWFFIGPPPVAATPVLSTIYINSADIGDTSLFDEASETDIDSTYARTGANSFRFHADGAYLLANLTSNATKYARFGLLALGVPPATARICAWLEDGTEHVSLWLTDGLELQMRQGSTVIQTSPTTLELGIWYCIEAKVVVHTTTGRFQVRIDGVDDMSAIGICTDADVDGAINQIQFEPPGEDVCIDDIMVREDGWCGTGGVYVVVPTMDGTVKDWASGDYTAIAEVPPTFDEYIEDGAGGGHTQLVLHSGVGDLDVNVVGVFALGRSDVSADVTFRAAARSILTDNAGYAQDLDTIGVYARLLMTTDPNGTVAWTVHAVNNALQIGAKS